MTFVPWPPKDCCDLVYIPRHGHILIAPVRRVPDCCRIELWLSLDTWGLCYTLQCCLNEDLSLAQRIWRESHTSEVPKESYAFSAFISDLKLMAEASRSNVPLRGRLLVRYQCLYFRNIYPILVSIMLADWSRYNNTFKFVSGDLDSQANHRWKDLHLSNWYVF